MSSSKDFSLLLWENPFPSTAVAYPTGRLNKASNFISMYSTTALPYDIKYDNCKNTLCYTHNKPTNYIYKPHSAYGMVGTSSAGYLGRRKRL